MPDFKPLQVLQFHDAPLDKMILDFENQSIRLHVEILEDGNESTTPMMIDFNGITNVIIDVTPFLYIEIYNADFTISDQSCYVDFLLLFGSGMPSGKLSFSFSEYVITKL